MRNRLTSVLPAPGSRAADANGRPAPAAPAPLARQRRRSMLWLGVALAALGALTVAWLFTATGHRVPVLAVSRDVPAGAVITQSDLSVATISSSGMTTIPARQESQVTGRTAAVGLQSGALLVPSDLTSASVPGPGEQLVPVPLKSGDLPASGLSPGDQVLVIATPGSGGTAGSGQSGAPALTGSVAATVYQVSGDSQTGDVTVDLIVAARDGTAVAQQASTGQIAIIVTPRNG